ncbi:DUF5753 domain-containing protein [Streptomyces nigrescens]
MTGELPCQRHGSALPPVAHRTGAECLDLLVHGATVTVRNYAGPQCQVVQIGCTTSGCVMPSQGRISRQKLLERKTPRPMLNFILEEAVLHRPIGSQGLLRAQLRHLRSCAELPFLGLQIMPTARCTHAALDGPLVLLEKPDHEYLAYIEAQRISFLVDDPDQVSVYQQVYGMLRSQALTPEETKSLLDDLLGES